MWTKLPPPTLVRHPHFFLGVFRNFPSCGPEGWPRERCPPPGSAAGRRRRGGELYERRGNCYLSLDEPDRAADEFEKYLKMGPGRPKGSRRFGPVAACLCTSCVFMCVSVFCFKGHSQTPVPPSKHINISTNI